MSTVLVTLVSAKGAPGVTTAVLAVAHEWPRTAVVIDADPAGGDIAAGLGRGSWPAASTLIGLASEAGRMPVEAALRNLVHRPGEYAPLVLAGTTTPGQARALPWPVLTSGLRQIVDADLLCDGGRYQPDNGIEPLLRASDHVVLVTGSSLPAARAAVRMTEVLYGLLASESAVTAGPRTPVQSPLSVLVVAPGRPYDADEIAAHCGAPLLGEFPHDRGTAVVWSEGAAPSRGMRRSGLQRAARAVAERLAPPALIDAGSDQHPNGAQVAGQYVQPGMAVYDSGGGGGR